MTLGKRLKMARERLVPKPTQGDIGAIFGISDKAVSAWERDDTVPEPDKLPKLREKLRVTYAWLLQGKGPPPDPTDALVLLEDRVAAEYLAQDEKKPSPRHTRPSKRA